MSSTYVGVHMDQQLQEIGARLKQARLAKKMSQPQLAEAADISISFLSNLETGRQAMNIKTLSKLLDILNVSADWLIGNSTDSANHAAALEIEKELASCTPKERDAILRLVLLMKEAIGSLKPEQDE